MNKLILFSSLIGSARHAVGIQGTHGLDEHCSDVALSPVFCDLYNPVYDIGLTSEEFASVHWFSLSLQTASVFNFEWKHEVLTLYVHPAQNASLATKWFCSLIELHDDICSNLENEVIRLTKPLQVWKIAIDSIVDGALPGKRSDRPATRDFKLNYSDYYDRILHIERFCSEYDPIVEEIVFITNCSDALSNSVESLRMKLARHFYLTRSSAMERMNIWELRGMLEPGNKDLIVVNPPAELRSAYVELDQNLRLIRSEQLSDTVVGEGIPRSIHGENISLEVEVKGGVVEAEGDAHTSTASLSSSLGDKGKREPSIHVLIATAGRRPEIYGMIASLRDLAATDYLTIVIDGDGDDAQDTSENSTPNGGSESSTPATTSSTATTTSSSTAVEEIQDNTESRSAEMSSKTPSAVLLRKEKVDFAKRLYRYAYWVLDCHVDISIQYTRLGYWGHGIRNEVRDKITTGDFVLHLDDDDVVLPGAIKKIKETCTDSNTLYLFQVGMATKDTDDVTGNGIGDDGRKENVFWHTPGILRVRNLSTPCGVIPLTANMKGEWGLYYGGDFAFYASLIPHVKHVQFVEYLILQYEATAGRSDEKGV